MKKITFVISALILTSIFTACGSKPQLVEPPPVVEEETGIPAAIQRARRNAPEDVLVGIGNAKMATTAMSRTTAATRARTEISQSMNTMVTNMVRDFTAASEVDPTAAVSFQENITVALSKSNLVGAVIIEEVSDAEGNWWVAIYLSKSNVANEINQAASMARLSVPAMASFDAEARMNEAFEQAKAEGR